MAVCVLLPEAESWLAQQEEIELPPPPPQPVRKKTYTLHPILLKQGMFTEARMVLDRHRGDRANHREYCAWCQARAWVKQQPQSRDC